MKYILATVFVMYSVNCFAVDWNYFGRERTDRFVTVVEKLEKPNDAITRRIYEANLHIEAKALEHYLRPYGESCKDAANRHKGSEHGVKFLDHYEKSLEMIEQIYETYARLTGRELK